INQNPKMDFEFKRTLTNIALSEAEIANRDMVLGALPSDAFIWDSERKGAFDLGAEGMRFALTVKPIVAAVKSGDPFLQHAALSLMIKNPVTCTKVLNGLDKDNDAQYGTILFLAVSQIPDYQKGNQGKWLRSFLTDPDEKIRFLAVKRVADDKL